MTEELANTPKPVPVPVPVPQSAQPAQPAQGTPTPSLKKAKRAPRKTQSKSSTPSGVSSKREKSKTQTKLSQQQSNAPTTLSHPKFPNLPPRPVKNPQQDSDEEELFCICHKPDTGELMVGCDGCNDWFHFRCVKVDRKYSSLISSFFCPYCEIQGKGKTLWKRKCRLDGCFAAISGNDSKYCSRKHGIEFMQGVLKLIEEVKNKKKKGEELEGDGKVEENKENEDEEEEEDDENNDELTRGQIKQIIKHTTSFDHFQKLGESLPEAPIDFQNDQRIKGYQIELIQLSNQREREINKKKMLMKTREFIKRINEEIMKTIDKGTSSKKKVKKVEICGFDPLFNESEESFESIDESKLSTSSITSLKDAFIKLGKSSQEQTSDETDDEQEDDQMEGNNIDNPPPTICLLEKKKCIKHNGWQSMINDEIDMNLKDIELRITNAEETVKKIVKLLNVDYFEQEAHELYKKSIVEV